VDIKAARFCKKQENAPKTQSNDNEGELSDAELYQNSPLGLNTKTELTRYLKLPAMPRETDIYHY
jgi:hypothetical protein